MIGELFLQLGQREDLRVKLAELEERYGSKAVAGLLDGLETLVARLIASAKDSPPASVSEPSPPDTPPPEPLRPVVPKPEPARRLPPVTLQDPFADLLASLDLREATRVESTARGEGKPDAKPAPKQETKPEPKPELKPEPKPELKPEPKPELKPEPKPEPKPESRPEPKSAPKPIPNAEPKEDAKPESKPFPTIAAAEEPTIPKPAAPKTGVHKSPATRRMTVSPAAPPPAPRAAPTVPAPEQAPPPQPEIPDLSQYLPKTIAARTVYPLDESDYIYFHAVAQIPLDEKPAAEPFILEERGIESRESVFALDRGGLRFYLSRVSGRSMNVSKNGMLLLSKQESLHLRGTHASILNNLRAYGLLLPFEFGIVAIGIDDLNLRIDENLYELRDALEETVATKWWSVEVCSLDAKMAQLVATDITPGGGREPERRGAARASAGGVRLDIKTLERVLTRQKGLAEEIHKRLEDLAGRADVDMIVGFDSGSSEDWKPILRASYEVTVPEIYRFNRMVTDLQYVHLKYQLMFTLTGDREEFQLVSA